MHQRSLCRDKYSLCFLFMNIFTTLYTLGRVQRLVEILTMYLKEIICFHILLQKKKIMEDNHWEGRYNI